MRYHTTFFFYLSSYHCIHCRKNCQKIFSGGKDTCPCRRNFQTLVL